MTAMPRRLMQDGLVGAAADPVLADRVALVCSGESWTYLQLFERASGLAACLQAQGIERGDRIAVYMDNTAACVTSIHAAWLAGGVLLVVNPQTKSDKLRFILEDSGARALLSDGHLASQFLPAVEGNTEIAALVCSGTLPGSAAVLDFETASADPVGHAAPESIPSDLAALIYTSGSTGQPKGVMQTHQAMRFALGSLIEYLRLASHDVIGCSVPLAFDYGLYQLLMSVELGATLVLERSFAFPAQVFANMREHAVSVFPGVPTMFAMLLASHARQALAFPGVRTVTNTAAALPDEFIARLQEVFPNARIYCMYGLTECKRVSYLEPDMLPYKPGSVGKAIPGTEVYLRDAAGNPVAPGETGILHVRGPHVMAGYWNRPDATAHMLGPGPLPGERVLCTHDLFRMDEEGYLYFVGRSDDIIKTRGEKVSPVEVENVLHDLGGVREAAVIGVPDPLLGEAIRACVVVDPASGLDEKRIRAHCAARLENFMLPRDVLLMASLPHTTTGKVSKKILREMTDDDARASA